MICKDCIHYRVCDALINTELPCIDIGFPAEKFCLEFKDKYRWINVSEGLPIVESINKRGDHTVQKSIRVLCACKQKSGNMFVKEGYYEIWDYSEEPVWRIPGNIDFVTHWMLLPELPKEEQ